MALIHCKECGSEISDESRYCPKCGKPSKDQQKFIETQERNAESTRISHIIIGLVLFAVGMFIMFGSCSVRLL